ncbi:MAG: hypothetical protein PWR06_1099 [Thermoanaerobacteraceae bacterium]|nr:hypothetical protein [Thermoanaerobacteraceae bacterium]
MAFIIGTAGTAKNTGKTTTTSAILDELYRDNILVGLTSIGYDGEEVDNITGLPKPRLLLKKGSIVATAKKCLAAGSAGYEILESTDIMTPLGKIMVVKITEDGLVVIAGPNKSSELKYILNMLTQKWNCKFIIVDGALNRIAPMVETDGIILATGAAKNTNIEELVRETRAFYELFNLPEVSSEEKKILHEQTKICLVKQDKDIIKTLEYGSLIDKKSADQIIQHIEEINTVYIPALLSENMLRELNQNIGSLWQNKMLVVKDPIKIVAGGNPENIINEINTLLNFGGKVKVLKKLPILAISVNPFYPLYRFEKNNYEAGFVNAEELFIKMKQAVPIPVVDVKRQGVNVLLSLIKAHI